MYYQNHQDYFQSSADQCRLFWQKWIPDDTIRSVLVFQHGLGDHSGRYQHLLATMQDSGTAIYAMEARGHGRSEGQRGHVKTFGLYADDLHQFVEMVRKEQQVDKIFLLGHSLGAVITADYAIKHQDVLQGLILSSSGIEAHMNGYFSVVKKVAGVLAKYAPALSLGSNLNLKYISHDEKVVADYKADPLTHGKATPALGHAMFNIHKELYAHAPELQIPLLVIHGTGDKLTDPKGSETFYQKANSADKTLKLYDGLYHEMMNEVPIARAEVLRDLRNWIEERI